MSEDTPAVLSPPSELAPRPRAAAPCGLLSPALPDHFSYSSMTAFQDCPRRWHYAYRAKAPRETIAASLLLGAALHAALEQINLAWRNGNRLPLAQSMAAFDAHWQQEVAGQTILFGNGEAQAGLRALADALLAIYSRECLPTLGRIVAVEERVIVTLPGLDVPVVGRLDVLVDSGQALIVVDAKTSKVAFTPQKAVLAAAQLSLYAAGLAPLARQLGKPLAGRFLVFRKTKQPRIDTVDVALLASDVQRTQRMLAETWALIQAAHRADSFPTRPSWMCRQCPFQERCSQETGVCM